MRHKIHFSSKISFLWWPPILCPLASYQADLENQVCVRDDFCEKLEKKKEAKSCLVPLKRKEVIWRAVCPVAWTKTSAHACTHTHRAFRCSIFFLSLTENSSSLGISRMHPRRIITILFGVESERLFERTQNSVGGSSQGGWPHHLHPHTEIRKSW